MAEQINTGVEESRVRKTEQMPLLTNEQLLRLLIKTQEELAGSQSKLAEAILESRKPYVDPKVLDQKRQELAERQQMIKLEMREREVRKKICPHKRENGTWNIKWMQHSNGIVLGVCGTCFSQFDARKQEDLDLLRQDLKSIKNMGRAGDHAQRGALMQA